MLSEERMEKLENVVMNFSGVMMSSMMGTLGEVLGGLADSISRAFDSPPLDSNGNPVGDISARLKETLPAEMLETFAADDEVEVDEEMREQVRQKLSDESADELFALVEASRCPLPKFTTRLEPEALLGYAYLAEQEDEEFVKMFTGVSDWMERNGELLNPE